MVKKDSLTAFLEKVQRSCDLVLGLGERKNSESVAAYLHFSGGHIAILLHLLWDKIGRITQEHWLDFMTPSTLLRLALDQFQLGNSTPLQSGKGMSVMNLNRLDFHTRLDHTIGNHNLFSELPAPSQNWATWTAVCCIYQLFAFWNPNPHQCKE